MRRSILMAFMLSACSSVEGEWFGECSLALGANFIEYEITSIELEEGSGDDLEGSGEVLGPDDKLSRGDVEGSQDGDDLDFLVRFTSGLNGQEMRFSGTADGAEMEGECYLGTQSGRFDLSRVQ